MNPSDWIAALELPPDARVDRIVAKKLLSEQCATTAAERRAIQDDVEGVMWLAVLKPATIGVPAYRDAQRDYSEIAVVHLTLRVGADADRHAERLHRSIPYPLVLFVEHESGLDVSFAHLTRGPREGLTRGGERIHGTLPGDAEPAFRDACRTELSIHRQPRTDLLALYSGWAATVVALLVARRTGVFAVSRDAKLAETRRVALSECLRLESEIAKLRAEARRETQLARRVELNLERRCREADLAATATLLDPDHAP